MQKQVLLVHGWGGTHLLHWQGWLQTELQRKGAKVFFPLLPNENFPMLKEWLEAIKKTVERFDENTICVGHSLGCPTILRLLENFSGEQKIGSAILVSAFAHDLRIPEIANFVDNPFDWKKIKERAQSFSIVYSDNDPFISVEEELFVAKTQKFL